MKLAEGTYYEVTCNKCKHKNVISLDSISTRGHGNRVGSITCSKCNTYVQLSRDNVITLPDDPTRVEVADE